MDVTIKALVYLIVGLTLLTINLWFFRAVLHTYVASHEPLVIAPFQVIGKDDAGGKLGATLASMLLARLGKIRQEMESSARALATAREGPAAPAIQTLDVPQQTPLSVPERLFAPLNITMTVGGVEVGGMISWVHRMLSRDSMLQISLHYEGDRAIAVTTVGGTGDRSLWIETKGGHDEVIADIAYALTHREFARTIHEVGALEVGEFKMLLSTLHKAGELNRQVAQGRAAQKTYEGLLPALEGLIEKAPRWRALVHFAAGIAENAGDLPKATALLRKELELTAAGDGARKELEARIGQLGERLAATTPLAAVPPTPGTPAPPRALGWPLAALGVSSRAMKLGPVIAVLGGVPPAGAIAPQRMQVLGTAFDDEIMTEYTHTLVQTIELVAPAVRFIFVPLRSKSGGTTTADLLAAASQAIAHAPDILLVTLGPLDGPIWESVYQEATDANILLVIAAGNEHGRPVPFAGKPMIKRVMVVAAVDERGKPTSFTQQDREAFWAPGEKIPLEPRPGKRDARAGTSYAAALAAGVAARVLAEHPRLERRRLLDLLRETSQPLGAGGVPVLNLNATLGRLSATGADPTRSGAGVAKPERESEDGAPESPPAARSRRTRTKGETPA